VERSLRLSLVILHRRTWEIDLGMLHDLGERVAEFEVQVRCYIPFTCRCIREG
jgi:hypothetical protein